MGNAGISPSNTSGNGGYNAIAKNESNVIDIETPPPDESFSVELLVSGFLRFQFDSFAGIQLPANCIRLLCIDFYGTKIFNSIFQLRIDRYGFVSPVSLNPNWKMKDKDYRCQIRKENDVLLEWQHFLFGSHNNNYNNNRNNNNNARRSSSKMMTHTYFQNCVRNHPRFKSLVLKKGIPTQFRNLIWTHLLNIQQTKHDILNEHQYQIHTGVNNNDDNKQSKIGSENAVVIDIDVDGDDNHNHADADDHSNDNEINDNVMISMIPTDDDQSQSQSGQSDSATATATTITSYQYYIHLLSKCDDSEFEHTTHLIRSVLRAYPKHTRFGMRGIEMRTDDELNNTDDRKSDEKSDSADESLSNKSPQPESQSQSQYLYKYEMFATNGFDWNSLDSFTKTQKQLFDCLKAFYLHTEVGLICCGGLNQVAQFLLLFMTDEQAFWALLALHSNPDKYFWTPTESGVYGQKCQRVLQTLMLKHLKPISTHLDRLQVPYGSLCHILFAGLFLARKIKFAIVVRIWDMFLLDGGCAVFQCVLGFFKYYEREIISTNDFEALLVLIMAFGDQDDFDVNRYMNLCQSFNVKHTDLQ